MTSKSEKAREQRPHAQADIADLQSWAASSQGGIGGAGATVSSAAEVAAQRETRSRTGGLAGHPLAPKVLVVAGVVIVGYLAVMLVVHLLMMLLMVLGGIAAVYAAYRIGYWRGRRDTGPVNSAPWLGSGRRRD